LPLADETAANTDLSEAEYVVTDSQDNALPPTSDPQAGSEDALFTAVIEELGLAAQALSTELTDAEQDDSLPLLLVEESLDEDSDLDDQDAQLWDIFGAEAITHLLVVEEFIAYMEAESPIFESPSEGIQRALHTLKGSAHMADVTQVAELATPLERFVMELRSYQVYINDDNLQLLLDSVS